MKDKQRPGLGDQCISSRLVHFTPSSANKSKERREQSRPCYIIVFIFTIQAFITGLNLAEYCTILWPYLQYIRTLV